MQQYQTTFFVLLTIVLNRFFWEINYTFLNEPGPSNRTLDHFMMQHWSIRFCRLVFISKRSEIELLFY